MFELILYNFSTSWKLLLIYLITLFILGCTLFFCIRNFNMKDGKIKTYGLLLGIDNMGTFILSIHIVRTFLVIYFSIFSSPNTQLTIMLIIISSIIYIVFDMRNIVFEIFNTGALVTVIYFINSLSSYYLEVESSLSVQIIRISLTLFTLMYITYYLLRSFENITSEKIE